MEEAEKVAKTIAVIDQGRIVIQGTSEQLKEKTKTVSLEEAFLSLTGQTIREQEVSSLDRMRIHRRVFHH